MDTTIDDAAAAMYRGLMRGFGPHQRWEDLPEAARYTFQVAVQLAYFRASQCEDLPEDQALRGLFDLVRSATAEGRALGRLEDHPRLARWIVRYPEVARAAAALAVVQAKTARGAHSGAALALAAAAKRFGVSQ